jgi:hypothetical protein
MMEEEGEGGDGRYLTDSASALSSKVAPATGAAGASMISTANHHSALAKYANKDVIVVASHHKTGTFLMQKVFARICAMMNWCCIFHVTKDSLAAVKNSLNAENGESLQFLCLSQFALTLFNYPSLIVVAAFVFHQST